MHKPIEFYHEGHLGAVIAITENGAKGVTVKDWRKYHSRQLRQTEYTAGKNHTLVLDYDIAVVDLDLKFVFNSLRREEIRERFLAAPLFKDTFTVETGSGGLHFYFRIKAPFTRGNLKNWSHDLCGLLAICELPYNVVIPGSEYKGREYSVINDAPVITLETAEELGLKKISAKDKQNIIFAVLDRAGFNPQKPSPVPEGARHETALKLGQFLGFAGLTQDEGQFYFSAVYEPMFQTGNGLSIDDLYRAVKDGIQYGASHREEKDERTREEIVLDYLRSYGWQFRHNYIKNKREFMRAKDNVWTEIGEYFFPDLAVVMGLEIRKTASVEGLKLVVNHLVNRHVYHAGRAFLENCPGKVYTDDDNALRRFMSGISTEDHQELLYWSLRKWFLEALYTIAAIEIDNSKANHTCLVFYGPQGVGKTSVTKLLVPHELQDFYYQDDFTKERDASNKLSEVFFINLDDIDNMYKNESKGLKSLISQSVINTRKAWKEEAPPTRSAVANFMATTNHIEFLTDETGNRRYFPVEITRLDWSVVTKELFAEIWQEAKHDYTDGRLDEIRKKTFALQPERQQHIERFEMPTGAEDYINTFFRPTKPDATSPPLLITMGQFEQAFSFYYKTVDKHLFNNRALGRVFNKLGYPPKVSVFVNKCRQVFIAEGVSHPLVDFIRDCDRFNLRYINTPPTPQEVGSFGGAVEDNPPDVSDTFPASN